MEQNQDVSADDALCFTPAVKLAAMMRQRELSPVELMAAILRRIERHEAKVNSFVTVLGEQAMEQARMAEKHLMSTPIAELPLLFGLPVSVKDLQDTAGVRTTYGSRHFIDHVPERDAPIWARLKAHGAILLGKTTTPEFGSHGITESLLTGITNNPWNLSRTSGGSSGGAAVAVAAGFGPLATGSDGGGSIRVPAAMCGIVGLKPSPGRIPVAEAGNAYESVGVVGPMTRTVADCALMLTATAGPHPHDPVSLLDTGTDFLAGLRGANVQGLRIGYCPDLRSGPIEAEVSRIVGQAVARFQSDLGAHVEVIDVSLPDPGDYFINWWGPALAAFHRDVLLPLGRPEDVNENLRMLVALGEKVDAATYIRTQTTVRSAIHQAFAGVFEKFDLMIWPTTPCVAFPHPGPAGGPVAIDGVEVKWPAIDHHRFTEAVSHAGYPAITVPAGFTAAGLPVGLQIAAGHGRDIDVLRAAAAFEAVAPWACRRPTL